MERGRGVVDNAALASSEIAELRNAVTPSGLPFRIRKIGHVVLMVSDVKRSTAFYTQVLGFKVSDVYPDSMMPGKMVFMRCNADHHGVALVGRRPGDAPAANVELDHLAFEVATLDEVIRARDHLRAHQVKIDFEGRRRAGCQIAVEFRDPDNHRLEIFWGLDQVGTDGHVRPPAEWREAMSIEDAIANPPLGQDTALRDPSRIRKSR
jgi:catechol 2,3-dioxygenase